MSVLEFTDTNIVVYAVGKDSEKRGKARHILAGGVTISAQVVNAWSDKKKCPTLLGFRDENNH